MLDKTQLTQYTLKLHPDTLIKIKIFTAMDSDIQYQYEFFDKAVKWAKENTDHLVALANSKEGSNRSYYLSKGTKLIKGLEEALDCNTTRALYTAIIAYLSFRELEEKSATVVC